MGAARPAAVVAAKRGQRRASKGRRWRVGTLFAFGCVLLASAAAMYEPIGGDVVEAVYCAAMTLFGVGYGDVCPRSVRARVGALAAMVLGGGFARGPVLERCRDAAYGDDGRWAPWQRFGVAVGAGALLFGRLEGWTPAEAAYFSTMTATTVGFGDVVPTTSYGRLAAIAYVLLTARLASRALDDVSRWWFFATHARRNPRTKAAVLGVLATTLAFSVADGAEGVDPLHCAVAALTTVGYGDACPRSARPRVRALVAFCVLAFSGLVQGPLCGACGAWARKRSAGAVVARLLVAAAAFSAVEGWPWAAGGYFALTTAGAVGFGDIAVKTPAGKLMACAFSLASVTAFSGVLNAVQYALRSWMRDHLGIRDADPRPQRKKRA